MSFLPTPSQHEAIITVDRPLAVTAGAGSGKTRVLVERYLHLLHQGGSVHTIAAITFTKKAAQEMKDRLRQARPDLIEELEQAQISTIHSLCQRIIQEHPLQAGIDPRFRVAEEWEAQALLLEVIEEIVTEQDLPEELGTPQEVVELAFDLYHQMLSKGDLQFCRSSQNEPTFGDFPALQLSHAVEGFLSLTPATEVQRRVMGELQKEWPRIKANLHFPDDELRLETLQVLSGLIKGIRGKMSEYTASIKELIAFGQGSIYQRKGIEVVNFLEKVLEHTHDEYMQKKKLLGVVDFNDLEQLALKLLEDPSVRSDYSFAHLMVDEFQDTNPLQKKIVDSLASTGALLFVVGDPKQSIYRFRGADVGVFIQTKEEIAQTGKNIFLAENFRSRPELIEFSNSFFGHLMEGEAIGFEASATSRERANKPCFTILRTPAEDLAATEGRELEAEQIALKIRELVEEGQYRYEQISLLFRAMTNVHIYEKALKEWGIPYVNLSGRGFYSKQEIRDVMHYFRWLEDPEDQVARLAVLRSPFYLLSDQALYWIRQEQWEKLSKSEQHSLVKSEEDYAFFQALSRHKPAPEVVTTLLERTGYLENTWRLPFGPQRVANMEKLLEQSWELFSQDLYTIPEQVRFLRLMEQDGAKEGEALLDAEHADVVVLRTIHGSKGLEFPVVFLPDTNGSVLRKHTGNVLYHPDYGLTYRGMESFEALKEQVELEEISESKRVLYVALTRAEEEFYWCARDGKADKNSWWNWLGERLGELPQDLYREIAGDMLPLGVQAKQGEVEEFKLRSYETLTPQYSQVSFSVTSLMNYARCPHYYYLRYILGVPERRRTQGQSSARHDLHSLSATQRGNIVHRVCEQIRKPQELVELMDYAAAMEGVTLDAKQRSQLESILRPYLQSKFFRRVLEESSASTWKIYHERDFNVPAGKFLINGLVDQVFVSENRLEVVDFKSNWITKEQVKTVGASYQVQLRLYAWAMAKEFSIPVQCSQAYFLIPNQLYGIEQELLKEEQTETWIIETCESIIAGIQRGAEAFPVIQDCAHCPQNSYCGKAVSLGENTDSTLNWIEEDNDEFYAT